MLRVVAEGKWSQAMTGEYSTPSGWPVTPPYKPLVKREGSRGGTGNGPEQPPFWGLQQRRSSPASAGRKTKPKEM